MRLVIGSKYKGHDSSIYMIGLDNHNMRFAISSERLSRYKHDDIFPISPISAGLQELRISFRDVKEIYFGSSFLTQDEELVGSKEFELNQLKRSLSNSKYLEDYQINFKNGVPSNISSNLLYRWYLFRNKMINQKDYVKVMLHNLFPRAKVKYFSFDHEECHAYSSLMTSNWSEGLFITMDGHGDNNRYSSVFQLKNGEMKLLGGATSPKRYLDFSFGGISCHAECSPGGLYSFFTMLLGFIPNADEGKLEALAAYGTPIEEEYNYLISSFNVVKYQNNISIVIDVDRLEKRYRIDLVQDLVSRNNQKDIAATIQLFLETIVCNYVEKWVDLTSVDKLVFSGGVFANVILNLRIFEKISESISITPAMADDGSAGGAAALGMKSLGFDIQTLRTDEMPFYGTSYESQDVFRALEKFHGIKVEKPGKNWANIIAKRILSGEVGALMHGRMEWGPRALGNRSIIADARDPNITQRINSNIKKRPLFQPFCPSILEEDRNKLFNHSYYNRHMTCAFRMREEFIKIFPSAVHIDGTARAQFVSESDNSILFELLLAIKRIIGSGIIINTSFNKHGRTIVESPFDALTDFIDTNIDFLFIEGLLLTKNPK
jgi:carbamoyltransferase